MSQIWLSHSLARRRHERSADTWRMRVCGKRKAQSTEVSMARFHDMVELDERKITVWSEQEAFKNMINESSNVLIEIYCYNNLSNLFLKYAIVTKHFNSEFFGSEFIAYPLVILNHNYKNCCYFPSHFYNN